MGCETLALDVTVDYGSTNSARPRETLSQDSAVRESLSTEWTDEKHCLYLKSMEASFINDLYNSVDTLGWRLQRQLGEKRPNTCISSGQYKVVRGGCWEKVKFENQKPQTNKENGPRVLLAHPWIQHFSSACREQNVLSCDLQERTSFGNLEVRGIGKMAFAPADLAANMKQFSLCRSDSVGSNTEVTGQNFIDEDSEGEKANHVSKAKRRKTNDGLTSSNDQVVPFGTHPSTQVVPKKSSLLGRRGPKAAMI
ncbi:cold-regulated protein 27-like [Rhododendron vialii]|uniref:cold-regulated protein 27-like n=1 Tax=Rhododendron vialii TaxID=182163 RepID=UPI00265DDCD3|nr:cold-regulated protein 27-like [Rhododendron vialii]